MMSARRIPQKTKDVADVFQSCNYLASGSGRQRRFTSIAAGRGRIGGYRIMLNSPRMSMTNEASRQAAEDRYYAALDHYAEGRLAEAISDYEAAIATDPTFLDAMHGLARAYQDAEQYDNAIAVANRITELDPDDVLAHTSLSILYQRKGMVPEAEVEANKARVLGWKLQLKQGKTTQP
jgi:tetratricopeptide (TPR) repeat protein